MPKRSAILSKKMVKLFTVSENLLKSSLEHHQPGRSHRQARALNQVWDPVWGCPEWRVVCHLEDPVVPGVHRSILAAFSKD